MSSFRHSSKGLLPFVQVYHSILSNVDRVEQVLDDGVGRSFLSSKLVDLVDKLDELSEGDAAGFLDVELHSGYKEACVIYSNIAEL